MSRTFSERLMYFKFITCVQGVNKSFLAIWSCIPINNYLNSHFLTPTIISNNLLLLMRKLKHLIFEELKCY